ncbi:hypothetical protein [Salinibaculum salinum]|uniref:hypothetical protein n=1 Tax=Salinibaculum salinum TaxID=3131996 RepID=UPI0030EEFEEE
MTSREHREGTHLELPVEVLEPLREADDNNWEIVTEALKVHLAVENDSLAALYRQVEELEQSIAEYDDEIQSLAETKNELVDRRKRLKEKIELQQEERREYGSIIDDIIDRLVDNPTLGIASQRSELRAAAEIKNQGVASEDAIKKVRSDVRARVTERNVDIQQRRLHLDMSAAETEDEEATAHQEFALLQEDNDGSE